MARHREFQREPPQDGQVGVKPDALDATDAEHRQRVVVLQAAELALDGGAATVRTLPLVAVVRDRGEREIESRLFVRDDRDAAALARRVVVG